MTKFFGSSNNFITKTHDSTLENTNKINISKNLEKIFVIVFLIYLFKTDNFRYRNATMICNFESKVIKIL